MRPVGDERYRSAGLPLHLVVDPRTMKIVARSEGIEGNIDYPELEALAAKNGP